MMTELGKIFNKKSVNKAEVSRRTRINASRISELSLNRKARLTAEEVVIIAKSMDIEPTVLLMELCKYVELVSKK